MSTPTPEQLAKLPKWAQEYIADIERQRFVAVRALDKFKDEQTPSPFYCEDHYSTGEKQGPIFRRKYIQTDSIEVEWRGVRLTVDANDYGNSGRGIRLQWSLLNRGLEEIAFVPTSYQSAKLMAKEDMR